MFNYLSNQSKSRNKSLFAGSRLFFFVAIEYTGSLDKKTYSTCARLTRLNHLSAPLRSHAITFVFEEHGVRPRFQKHSIPVSRSPVTQRKNERKKKILIICRLHTTDRIDRRTTGRRYVPYDVPGQTRARTGFQNTGRFCLSRNNKRARIWVIETISFLVFRVQRQGLIS